MTKEVPASTFDTIELSKMLLDEVGLPYKSDEYWAIVQGKFAAHGSEWEELLSIGPSHMFTPNGPSTKHDALRVTCFVCEHEYIVGQFEVSLCDPGSIDKARAFIKKHAEHVRPWL
jgi:hypothetical protein